MSATLSRSRLNDSSKNELREIAEQSSNPEVKELLLQISSAKSEEILTIRELPKDLTPNEAAGLLGVSRTFINKLLRDSELPFYMVGNHKRIPFDAFEAFVEQREKARKSFAESIVNERELHEKAVRELMDLM
ncbi:helix-turn-helix domain-containing protein [Corynebacterium freiburgense]|uniref:helix-turn-helix domain-containing protein n=1 Tax=Corynebacterium freiburgense TaxID=556548 RepID=UPI0004204AF8|nr:helix-turn-helix domain-containing protein [Corynebacterium freiburgense]WJZ01665.1 Helix-turn-helix domain protein [Corynebacterium freiburgense]